MIEKVDSVDTKLEQMQQAIMDSTSKKLELIAEAVINKLEGDNDMGGGASTNKEKRTE